MPSKRAANPAASDAADTNDSETAKLQRLAAIPRNKRWAAVSGSANADAEHRLAIQNPVKAYSIVCLFRPPF